MEQSPLSIHVFAPDGSSLLANSTWSELWYLEEGEAPEGANVFEDEQVRAVGLVPYIEDSIACLRSVNTPPLFYEPARCGHRGDRRWIQASAYPVIGEDGRLLEVTLVIEDITQRKQAEDALRDSEE